MKKTIQSTALSFLALVLSLSTYAQLNFPHDSTYYETYVDKITARIYASQKYIRFSIPSSSDNVKDLEYAANTKLNLGLGFTYHNISLNAFYGFGFVNKNNDVKGKTKGLDLQLHLYPKKWAVDVLAIFPKGFYLRPQGYAANSPSSYYIRPDIKVNVIGLSAYRVPNKERFSYRAAIIQNEWQKKSAGSPLYGGEVYSLSIKGDSTIIPRKIQNSFPQAGLDKLSIISIGPAIGYAYTVVMDQHFFITASLVGNLGINFTNEQHNGITSKKTAIGPAAVYKAALGYNSSTWSLTGNITGNALLDKGALSAQNYVMKGGAYRISLARKFDIHKKHHS